MKKYYCFLVISICTFSVQSQSYQGFQTGNYTGVNGVFFNPANVVDSRYSWDFNLAGVSLLAGNNNASLSFSSLTKNFDSDSLLNQFTSKGNNKGLVMADIHGPSLMFNVGRKSALAFTTRAVAMVNIHHVDGQLIKSIVDGSSDNAVYPYNINMPGQASIKTHGYTEYGVTFGQVLLNKNNLFLKGGITGKYLSGAGNFYMQFNDVKATLDRDAAQGTYLSNATGGLTFGFSGMNFSDVQASDILKSNSSGWGADIGFIFELRNENANESRDENKYKLKVAAALQDFGSISYERDPSRSASYKMNIAGSQRFYTANLDVSVDSFKTVLDRYPQFFAKNGIGTGSYTAKLPASVALNVDYHLHKGFYINAGAQIPLTSANSDAWNTYKYFNTTVTPRFEGRGVSVFIPVSYHQLSGITAGAALRLGFLYIGSGSILNAVVGKTKQVDAMIGFHIGRLFHHKERRDGNAGTSNN